MEITWTREIAYAKEIKRADIGRLVALIAEHHDATVEYDRVGELASTGKLVDMYPHAAHALVAEFEARNRGKEVERGEVDSIIFAV